MLLGLIIKLKFELFMELSNVKGQPKGFIQAFFAREIIFSLFREDNDRVYSISVSTDVLGEKYLHNFLE